MPLFKLSGATCVQLWSEVIGKPISGYKRETGPTGENGAARSGHYQTWGAAAFNWRFTVANQGKSVASGCGWTREQTQYSHRGGREQSVEAIRVEAGGRAPDLDQMSQDTRPGCH